jgi:hypothetical protein
MLPYASNRPSSAASRCWMAPPIPRTVWLTRPVRLDGPIADEMVTPTWCATRLVKPGRLTENAGQTKLVAGDTGQRASLKSEAPPPDDDTARYLAPSGGRQVTAIASLKSEADPAKTTGNGVPDGDAERAKEGRCCWARRLP